MKTKEALSVYVWDAGSTQTTSLRSTESLLLIEPIPGAQKLRATVLEDLHKNVEIQLV